MKDYLVEFLKRYDYPTAAQDTLTGAYAAICENAETLASWERMLSEYQNDAA